MLWNRRIGRKSLLHGKAHRRVRGAKSEVAATIDNFKEEAVIKGLCENLVEFSVSVAIIKYAMRLEIG